MMLSHMVLEIRELWKGTVAVLTGIGLLSRMSGANMNVEAILLRESLIARRARITREVRIAMIDNEALFSSGNRLRTSRHATAPQGAVVGKREREGGGRDRHSGRRTLQNAYKTRCAVKKG
jgi:hypothetical protein